jgi:hypothetical protein
LAWTEAVTCVAETHEREPETRHEETVEEAVEACVAKEIQTDV